MYTVQTHDADDEDEDVWDANDWCFIVTKEPNEMICICATKEEAEHIAKVLNDHPIPT